jgi:hypothetical protein
MFTSTLVKMMGAVAVKTGICKAIRLVRAERSTPCVVLEEFYAFKSKKLSIYVYIFFLVDLDSSFDKNLPALLCSRSVESTPIPLKNSIAFWPLGWVLSHTSMLLSLMGKISESIGRNSFYFTSGTRMGQLIQQDLHQSQPSSCIWPECDSFSAIDLQMVPH